MTTIDQRILIPAPSDLVWNIISNLENNPTWQADCESITYLTSIRNRAGTRWRYTSFNRREYVLEITAWYEGLGYEYTFIDGAQYKESKGRLRLQEIPEGTIVQWTFTYELGGILGGVRNTLGTKGKVEGILIDSLRGLWQRITDAKGPQQVREAKSLMRDAPDVHARARYIPRYPSTTLNETPPPIPIVEPPVAEDDTRPNKPVVAEPAPEAISFRPPQTPVEEPDFLADLQALEPVAPAAPLIEPATNALDEALHKPGEPAPIPEKQLETPAPVEQEKIQAEQEAVDSIAEKPAALPSEVAPANPGAEAPPAARDTSKLDTAQISVFEIFGLPKPSETQELRAVIAQALPAEPEISKEDTSPHIAVKAIQPLTINVRGYRVLMRRHQRKLRFPT